jgi:hypothetical protein
MLEILVQIFRGSKMTSAGTSTENRKMKMKNTWFPNESFESDRSLQRCARVHRFVTFTGGFTCRYFKSDGFTGTPTDFVYRHDTFLGQKQAKVPYDSRLKQSGRASDHLF